MVPPLFGTPGGFGPAEALRPLDSGKSSERHAEGHPEGENISR